MQIIAGHEPTTIYHRKVTKWETLGVTLTIIITHKNLHMTFNQPRVVSGGNATTYAISNYVYAERHMNTGGFLVTTGVGGFVEKG
ncbi:hypothetical protein EV1_024460 [Malus domestica]